jgi:flavodoxin
MTLEGINKFYSVEDESSSITMRIEYIHASVYGNGAKVAEEFKNQMSSKGILVDVHHVDDADPKRLPPAELYVFSSPGRFGKPIKDMRRFLEKINLPAGTKYAVLTTEPVPQPDKKTGKLPTEAELGVYQHVMPIMNEMLSSKGLVKVAQIQVYVTGLKGPLETGWQMKVESFVKAILSS